MELIIQSICLCLTLFILQRYIAMGIHAKTHRLLPIVLSLICLYGFYEVFETISGQYELFVQLKDMLLMQAVYLLIFYLLDVLNINLEKKYCYAFFASLIGSDLYIVHQIFVGESYTVLFAIVIYCYIIVILGLATYAYIKHFYTYREHIVSKLLYGALCIPAITLLFRYNVNISVLMPISLTVSSLIVYCLMFTDRLVDSASTLKDNLFDNSEVALILFDQDCYFLNCNKKAMDMFPIIHKKIENKEKKSPFEYEIKIILAEKNHIKDFEEDGIYYRCRITRVCQYEKLKGYIMFVEDISETTQRMKKLEEEKKQARMQTQWMGKYLASMSHDLKTPINAIITISDFMSRKEEISRKNKSFLLDIKNEGQELLELINSILLFSKLKEGRISLVERKYDWENLIEEIGKITALNMYRSPVELEINFEDSHPKYLIGDKMRVKQMIQNLLSNAVKFTKSGKITCNIRNLSINEEEKCKIVVEVIDTGVGMPEDTLQAIFVEYVSFAKEHGVDGTGLGLGIVSYIASLMKGDVIARQNEQGGATFTLNYIQGYELENWLPDRKMTKNSLLNRNREKDNDIEPEYGYPNGKILLIDDLKINQQIFKELVRPWQCNVVIAQSGEEAKEIVKYEEFDIIFIDYLLPDTTGSILAEEIQKYSKAIFVAFSANTNEEIKQEEGYQFQYYLKKPIDLQELKCLIENLMPKSKRTIIIQQILNVGKTNKTRAFSDKTIEIYQNELEKLIDDISVCSYENLKEFRIKVHGIKSASRQFGNFDISEMAETLEMASKTNNISYIKRHLEHFIESVKEEIEQIQIELEGNRTEKVKVDKTVEETEDSWKNLYKAFQEYSVSEIDSNIEILENITLSSEDTQCLQEIKKTYNDLEYEECVEKIRLYKRFE